MSPSESPFKNTQPSFHSSVLEFAHAIVCERPITQAILDLLPFRLSGGETLVLETLGQTKWLDTKVLDAFVKLMPSRQNSCIILPTNWLTGWSLGSSFEHSARIMLGLDEMERNKVCVNMCSPDEHITECVIDNAADEWKATFSKSFHAAMGACYDPIGKQLLVSHGDCIVCLCFNGTNHFRLMLAQVCQQTVSVCVWDPLDVEAIKVKDEQVCNAEAVLQALLPKHVVKVVSAKSMCLLNSSEVFSSRQLDGYQCGAFCIRALTKLVYKPEVDLGEQSLRNIRIWMAACLAQRNISL